jgi:hypothetical protein
MPLGLGDPIPPIADATPPAMAHLAAQRGRRPTVLFLLRAFT